VSGAALLAELRSRDVQVWADGDQLRCNAPAGALTPELRDQLRQRKGDILEFLRMAGALARQQRAIVPLQPRGSHASVFAVGGHNGDVFCYRALAQQIGDDQPFFGLQPPGLDGHEEPLRSVEDLAACFSTQIRAFQPGGPYVIAGFCSGGAIAFEVARQLVQQGAAVPFVALFAAPYPAWFRFLPQMRERLTEGVRRHARSMESLSPGERLHYVVERLRRRRTPSPITAAPPDPPDPVVALRMRVEDVTLAAVRRYEPRHYTGRLSLFLPKRAWLHAGYGKDRWRSVAREIDEYYGPEDTDRDGLLREPNVAALAELFRRCRRRSGGLP
jgi:thioesterase domain-containing protein